MLLIIAPSTLTATAACAGAHAALAAGHLRVLVCEQQLSLDGQPESVGQQVRVAAMPHVPTVPAAIAAEPAHNVRGMVCEPRQPMDRQP